MANLLHYYTVFERFVARRLRLRFSCSLRPSAAGGVIRPVGGSCSPGLEKFRENCDNHKELELVLAFRMLRSRPKKSITKRILAFEMH